MRLVIFIVLFLPFFLKADEIRRHSDGSIYHNYGIADIESENNTTPHPFEDCAVIESKNGNTWDCTPGLKEKLKSQNEKIERTEKINFLKKQCEELGFKPDTNKFKDCVVELM